jgi:hypothetical protein
MSLSLVLLDGPTPAEAHPILVTSDPNIIAAVRRLILERLAVEPSGQVWQQPQRFVARQVCHERQGS